MAYSQYGDKNNEELSEKENNDSKTYVNKLKNIKSTFIIKMKELQNWLDT